MRRECFAWALCGTLVGFAAVTSGCASGDATDTQSTEATAAVREPIQGGYRDEADKAVVGIQYVTGYEMFSCTGSLLAPNLVLTAQHCVSTLKNEVSGGVVCSQTTFGNPYPAA